MIIIYAAEPIRSRCIEVFESIKIQPMVDGVHTDGAWFRQNYRADNHRAYYTTPFLINGKISEIDFGISSFPHFVISGEFTEPQWDCINRYLLHVFDKFDSDTTLDQILVAKDLLAPPVNPIRINFDDDEYHDPLVVKRDLNENYYVFESKQIPELDIMIYSIKKPYIDLPFTVIIQDYSVVGAKYLFTDLYNSKDWGGYYADCAFLEKLWVELKLPGVLNEQLLNETLKERVLMFLPQEDGTTRAEPMVYRKTIDDVLNKSPLFGKIITA